MHRSEMSIDCLSFALENDTEIEKKLEILDNEDDHDEMAEEFAEEIIAIRF